ncbi:hypothetical protein PsYK624_058260 [Phanerochaete sordida]|uniref:Uncharacterized protein n=1 Tax=Phanerochaete sordida TaxID=48140 RepID=A0A9P3G8A4_9APHY|nr:hypothetical protein PsYK624_058260 [Phanerochaete sordida]
MLIFFFCVRRRRRQHAEPLDWEAVQTAGIFHGVLRTPRTPKTPPTPSSTGHGRAASPEMSQQSHTSQYALAPAARGQVTSPTGSARTTISPLLIVATSPRSETSYHTAEDADPFADPLAMARMRPPLPAASPTIRVSDTTLVDPNTRLSAFKNLGGEPKYGYEAKIPHDSLLLPPPALAPTTGGRSNRLSHGSLEETLPSPNGSVDTGCAI